MARRAKGEGSLYQSKSGDWIYQYREDGRRRTKRFHRKAEAKAFIDAMEPALSLKPAERQAPDRRPQPPQYQPREEPEVASGGVTVGEWMTEWLEVYARPTIKLSTYVSYEQYVRGHIIPNIGDLPMSSLKPIDLQAFFNNRKEEGNLKNRGGLSTKTLTNLRNMMHLAFEQAVKEDLLARNLVEDVRLPKASKQEMRVLNREEQERLTLASRLAPEPAAFGIIFDLFTGLRLGELCALRWENVDMERNVIWVEGTRNRLPNFNDSIETATSVVTHNSAKTESSRRVVHLLDELALELSKYREIQMSIAKQYPGYNPEGYVFCQMNGRPYEPRTYMDLFKRCVKRAGIADANFHCLRHTFATRSFEEGMDVVTLSKLMGHSDPEVTLKKYGHALPEQKKVSVEKLKGVYESGGRHHFGFSGLAM